MHDFFEFLKVLVVGFVVLLVVFLILLSLPKSKLRSFLLEITGWGTAAASVVSVFTPISLIPGIGEADDIFMLCVAIASAIFAYHTRKQRLKLYP